MTLAVAAIVEGHGEVASARILIQRIASHVSETAHVDVLRPIRIPRGRIVRERELRRAMEYAAAKLEQCDSESRLILVLFDADEDCAAELGPRIQALAQGAQPEAEVVCAIACVEYETWFVASAGSLDDLLDPGSGGLPGSPESDGLGKGWIRAHMRSGRYSETIDQPKLTARIDVELCASRSPSFARLVSALATHLGA